MARHAGVSLKEGTNHSDGSQLLAALDAWTEDADRRPRFVSLWNNWSKPGRGPAGGAQPPDPALLEGILSRGVEPMIYATTTRRFPAPAEAAAWNLQSYIDGDHDGLLTDWAAELASEFPGQRFIVRIDQEPASSWAPWGPDEDRPSQTHPTRFKRMMGHVRTVLQAANPSIRTFYCGNRGSYLTEYFPGDARCDYVGFDTYSREARQDTCPKIMDAGIRRLRRVSDRPVIVGEFGRKVGLPDRLEWIRTLDDVRNGHIFMAFDIDLTELENVDWTMTPAMRKSFAGLE